MKDYVEIPIPVITPENLANYKKMPRAYKALVRDQYMKEFDQKTHSRLKRIMSRNVPPTPSEITFLNRTIEQYNKIQIANTK